MKFESRVKQEDGALIPSVDLKDSEADIYKGSGWAVAYVNDGEISEFKYIGEGLCLTFDLDTVMDDAHDHAKELIDEALKQKEAWFGCCSSYQFTDPLRIELSNPALLAKIIRIAVEQTVEEIIGD